MESPYEARNLSTSSGGPFTSQVRTTRVALVEDLFACWPPGPLAGVNNHFKSDLATHKPFSVHRGYNAMGSMVPKRHLVTPPEVGCGRGLLGEELYKPVTEKNPHSLRKSRPEVVSERIVLERPEWLGCISVRYRAQPETNCPEVPNQGPARADAGTGK